MTLTLTMRNTETGDVKVLTAEGADYSEAKTKLVVPDGWARLAYR